MVIIKNINKDNIYIKQIIVGNISSNDKKISPHMANIIIAKHFIPISRFLYTLMFIILIVF